MNVERVAPAATHRLRQVVLRPHQSIGEMRFPGDDEPDAGHFAAMADGEVVAVASVLVEAPPWDPLAADAWRLRGMATAAGRRGQGTGTALLSAAIDHVRGHGGRLLWCNARLPAVEFYRRAGFAARGEAWEEPHIGPHVAMQRAV